jgi:hypothetical protein
MSKNCKAFEIKNDWRVNGNSEFSHYYFKEQYATIIF